MALLFKKNKNDYAARVLRAIQQCVLASHGWPVD